MPETKDTYIDQQTAIENAGYQNIEEVMRESLFGASFGVPAQCEHGCRVEPDGKCPHGQNSVLVNACLI